MRKLLLASSSPYRQQLLQKLELDFDCCTPDIDESRLPNESAYDMVERLAVSKARKLANQYPQHLIIASDQAACLGQQILGKPLGFEQAFTQLSQCRGHEVVFLTGLCLHNAETGQTQSSVESYKVKFKDLTDQQITNYLHREEPYDCAGSFKVEGLGISLFDALEGDDPNTLIGLPLIALIRMLNKEGIDPLLA
jgi:septum formation protein